MYKKKKKIKQKSYLNMRRDFRYVRSQELDDYKDYLLLLL